MYDDILIPTDGSEGVQQAIDHGIDLAAETDATVHGLFVVDTTNETVVPDTEWLALEETLTEAGREAVADVQQRASERGVEVTTTVKHGRPHEAIIAHAEKADADLIVMGTHGRSGIDRVLLGSVTDKVVRHAERPVLVQRIEDSRSR